MPGTLTIAHTTGRNSKNKSLPNERKNPTFLQKAIAKFKAHKQKGKIIKALNEVKKIEACKQQPKSFDEFLSGL